MNWFVCTSDKMGLDPFALYETLRAAKADDITYDAGQTPCAIYPREEFSCGSMVEAFKLQASSLGQWNTESGPSLHITLRAMSILGVSSAMRHAQFHTDDCRGATIALMCVIFLLSGQANCCGKSCLYSVP